MNTEQAYIDQLIPRGSNDYYSYHFLTFGKKQWVLPIAAFCKEIHDIPYNCQEPAIADAKLAWWNTEIEHAFQKNPRHPITKAMQNTLQQFDLSQALFHEYIQHIQLNNTYQLHRHFTDVIQYCHRNSHIPYLLMAAVLGYNDANTLLFCHDLGIACQLITLIKNLKIDFNHHRFLLAEEDLQRYHLTVDNFQLIEKRPQLVTLLQHYAGLARKYYQQALAKLPPKEYFSLHPLLIQGRLAVALLEELERGQFQILQHQLTLTPLHKFWLAWRTYRRAKQHGK